MTSLGKVWVVVDEHRDCGVMLTFSIARAKLIGFCRGRDAFESMHVKRCEVRP